MGWLGGALGSLAGAVTMGPIGAIGGLLGGSAIENSQANAGIDASKQYMDRPSQLDPNALPSNIAEQDRRLASAGTTASPWLGMATQQQRLDEAHQGDQAMAQSAGATAGARSSLAMRGGLSGGAAERLANSGMQSGMMAQNDIRRQGMSDRLGLGMKDYDTQRDNVGLWSKMADSEAQRKSNLMETNYSEGMRAWAANQAANAQLESQKKTGPFGLW